MSKPRVTCTVDANGIVWKVDGCPGPSCKVVTDQLKRHMPGAETVSDTPTPEMFQQAQQQANQRIGS